MTYSYVIRTDDAQIELYINRGDAVTNKQIFETLLTQRETIETAFGKPLDWQKLEDRLGCRIRYVFSNSGLQDRDKWPELQKRMIEAMVDFQRALQPEISKIK